MADEQQQQTPQRRFSWSYLFSFLLIVGIIVTVIVLLFGGNKTTTLSKAQFIDAIGNDRVSEIVETPKENTLVSIEGYYTPANVTKPTSKKFKVVFSYAEFYEEPSSYVYLNDSDNKLHYVIDDTVCENPETIDNTKAVVLNDFLKAKADKARLENPDKPSFVIDSAKDPYVTTWWDQWGPTIIMLGGSLLIFILLFGRLSSSINGSNNKALEFNRSYFRRYDVLFL